MAGSNQQPEEIEWGHSLRQDATCSYRQSVLTSTRATSPRPRRSTRLILADPRSRRQPRQPRLPRQPRPCPRFPSRLKVPPATIKPSLQLPASSFQPPASSLHRRARSTGHDKKTSVSPLGGRGGRRGTLGAKSKDKAIFAGGRSEKLLCIAGVHPTATKGSATVAVASGAVGLLGPSTHRGGHSRLYSPLSLVGTTEPVRNLRTERCEYEARRAYPDRQRRNRPSRWTIASAPPSSLSRATRKYVDRARETLTNSTL